jgi:hypothetical protein
MTNLQTKLEQIQTLVAESLAEITTGKFKIKQQSKPKAQLEKQEKGNGDKIIQIVNKIKNCEEADEIEINILNENGMAGRILLPFYISYKYFSQAVLTTGNVEKITAELGVRIKSPNVANAIKGGLYRYLVSNTTRIKGAKTFYKLNRKGAKYFEVLLGGKADA